MAKKSSKRAAKKKTAAARKSAPARKLAAKKASAKKVSATKTAAKKPAAKKPAAKKTKAARQARPSREVELGRFSREDPELEEEVEDVPLKSKLPESAEYIPEALEDPLAEQLGEAMVESATSGDQADENIRDEDVPEDDGGPFVETTAQQEFAGGTDASNPEDAEPADFPTANARRKK